jgi:hypothetical protein
MMGTYLYAEVASIDVITKEKIASVGGTTANFEKFHEVVLGIEFRCCTCRREGKKTYILTMDVTTDCEKYYQ